MRSWPRKAIVAKTAEDLAKSREARAAIIANLGEVPQSILVRDFGKGKALDFDASERSYTATYWENGNPTGQSVFHLSSAGCGSGALSRFPQNIGRLLVRFYTEEGATVVDPFAGHNSRAELCWRSRRNYIGIDLSRAFTANNAKVKAALADEKACDMFPETVGASINFIRADSTQIPLRDEVGDFTITSPPYWDIEYYGDEAGQLGSRSYEDFLALLGKVACENFRVLKPGSYCVWCVNDFRRGGVFYPYHEHTTRLMREAGFRHHDTAIIDLGPSIAAAFATQVVERKVFAKRHEYILVFQKPGKEGA
jgi:DNA modification methylase